MDRAAAASALVSALSSSSAAGVTYALNRLVRGTASATGCARLGFAAAITAALRAAAAPAAAGTPLADLTPDVVMAAITGHYKGRFGAAGAGEGVNLREAALGRLFSTAAVVRAVFGDDDGGDAEAGRPGEAAEAGVVPPLGDDALASAMDALAATATTANGRWGLGDAAAAVATTLLGTPPHPPASAAAVAAAARRRKLAAACPAATSAAAAWATARAGAADGLIMATALSAAGLAPSPGWLGGLYGRLDAGGGPLLFTTLAAPLRGAFPAPAAADAVAAAWRSAGRAVVAEGGGEALAALWTRGVTSGLLGVGGSAGKRMAALVLLPVGILLAATVPSANGRAVALRAVLSPAASTALVTAAGVGGRSGGDRSGGRRPGRGGGGRGRRPHLLRRPAVIDAALLSPAARAAARSAGPAIAASLSSLPLASGAPTAAAVLKWATATPTVGRALGIAALRSLAATADVGAVVAAVDAVLGSPRRNVAADAMALDVLAAAVTGGGGNLSRGAIRGGAEGGHSDSDDDRVGDGGGTGGGNGIRGRAVAVVSALASIVARGRPGAANAVAPAMANLAGRKLLGLLSANGEGGVGVLANEALARLAAAGCDEGLTDNGAGGSADSSDEDKDMEEDKDGDEDEDSEASDDSDDDDDGGRSPAATAAAMEAECAQLLGAPPAGDASAPPPAVTAAFKVLLSVVRLARMLLGNDRTSDREGVDGNDDVEGDASARAGASELPKAGTTADAELGPYLSDLLSALRVALGAVYAGEAESLPKMVDDDDDDDSSSGTDSDPDGDSASRLSPAGHLVRVVLAGIATPSAPLRDAVAAVWRELVDAGGVDSDALDVLFTVFEADDVDAVEEDEEDGEEEGGGSTDGGSTADTDSDKDEDDSSDSGASSSDESSAAERPSRAAGTDDDAMDESATDSDNDSDSTSSGDSGIDPDSEDPAILARYDASLSSYLSLLAAKRGEPAAAARRRRAATATRQRALELVTIYARSCRRLLTTVRGGRDGSLDGPPPSAAVTEAAAGLLSLAPRLVSAAASSPDAAVRSGEVLAKHVTRTPAVLGRVLGGAPIGAQVAAAVVAMADEAPTSALSVAFRTAAAASLRAASAVYVHAPPAGGGAPFEEEAAASPALAALALYARSRGRRWLGGEVEAAFRGAPPGVAARLAAAAAAAVADPATSAYVRASLVGELARGLAAAPAATAARAEVWAAARDAVMAVVAGCGGRHKVKAEDRRDPLGDKAARWKELVGLVSVALGGTDGAAAPGAAAWTPADVKAAVAWCKQRGFPISRRGTAK
ncbi:hypothetical protein MMPV_005494 [Pyropia vietnamensis]